MEFDYSLSLQKIKEQHMKLEGRSFKTGLVLCTSYH